MNDLNKNFNLEEKEIGEAQENPEEEVHVMSDYLNNKKPGKIYPAFVINQGGGKKKKTFPLWLIWIFFGFIIIVFAGVFYVNPNFVISLLGGQKIINQNNVNQDNNQIFENLDNVNNSQPILTNSPEQILKSEIKEGEEIILSIEFSLPKGAVSANEKITIESQPSTVDGSRYKIIGGLFKISPLTTLNKSAALKIFYNEKNIEKSWEDDLKIGYFQDNLWIVLPTEVNIEKNTLSTQISSFYSGIFAPVVTKDKAQPSLGDLQEIAPGIFLGSDQDNDGLTDQEEVILGTNLNNPDTDNDGSPDGMEVVNLYSPTAGYGVKLADTDIVKIYSNQTFKYSLFYPSSFLPKAMIDTDDSEVIISTNLGEFFSILVQDNPDNLDIIQWYERQINNSNQELRKTEVDGSAAVWSLDGLSLYVGHGDKIYVLSYNIGGGTVANLKATFLMMIRSFKFLN